jgi:hypothetical protein
MQLVHKSPVLENYGLIVGSGNVSKLYHALIKPIAIDKEYLLMNNQLNIANDEILTGTVNNL